MQAIVSTRPMAARLAAVLLAVASLFAISQPAADAQDTGCYYSWEAHRSYCYGNQGGGYSPSDPQMDSGRGFFYHDPSGHSYTPNFNQPTPDHGSGLGSSGLGSSGLGSTYDRYEGDSGLGSSGLDSSYSDDLGSSSSNGVGSSYDRYEDDTGLDSDYGSSSWGSSYDRGYGSSGLDSSYDDRLGSSRDSTYDNDFGSSYGNDYGYGSNSSGFGSSSYDW